MTENLARPAAAPTPPSAPWSWPRIAWTGAAFIALVSLMAAWDIVRDYRSSVDTATRELGTQAAMVAEQTARSMQTVDLVLRHVGEDYRGGALSALDASGLRSYLSNQAIGLPQIEGLRLLDAYGRAVAAWDEHASAESAMPPSSTAGSDAGAALRIGPALRLGGAAGPRVFAITRDVEPESGRRAGAVMALVGVDYFDRSYREARFVDGTKINLLHLDGTLLARQPALAMPPGRRPALFDAVLRQRSAGRATFTSPLDGIERYAALAPVTGYPLTVVVTRDRSAVLAPWLDQTAGTLLRTLALAALAAALMLLLRRQMAHLRVARASLRVSRDRFALAAAGADVGIWDWDIAGNRVFASPRTLQIYGFDGVGTSAGADDWFGELPGPLRASTDAALLPGSRDQWFAAIRIHPDDVARRDEAIRAHLADETPAYFSEFRVRGDDGEWRWVSVRGLCVRNESGEPLRMAGSVADIDSRKRAEDASRKSEQRFALAVAGSDDGVWDFDYAADEAFASQRARQIMGLPLQPEVQRPLRQWVVDLPMHPDDAREQHEAVRAHLDGRTPAFEGEWRFRRPDGGWRWVRVRGVCVRDAAGAPLRMAGSVSDIDARKRAEQALRQSEERYALAVAGSDDGVWDWDYVTGLAFESARARQLQGLPTSPEQQPLAELQASLRVHPDDAPRRAEGLRAHLAGETPHYECEYRVRHDDGGERWVRVRALCIRDAAGKPVRIAGSVSDIDAHKRAQEALRRSEERFALAVAGSNDGVLDWNARDDSMYFSERALRIVGIDAEEAVRSRTEWAALLEPRLHPDDLARRDDALRAHLAGETPAYISEYRVRGRDGDWRWVLVRGVCVRDATGEPLRMAGSVADIDSRKRAEDGLRKSEERFALAVAGSNDGILDWHIGDDSMYVSARALQIAGIEADADVRTRADWMALLMPRLHPDDARKLKADLRVLADNGHTLHDGEYRVRDGGGYRWIRFRGQSVSDAAGQALRWAGSVSDIDASKQVEAALRQSEERYQLAVDGSNEGLWDWDLPSDRLFLSPRAQELLWLEPTEPQQARRYWIDHTHYHPDDVAGVRAAISAHLRGQTPHFMVEYRLRHHSGAWHWYRQRGIAVRDAQGRPTRMAGSMEDITERKSAEAQRERLEVQLRQAQKLEAIGTLAGGIAHDFNNILAAILGYGELAQKDAAEGSALRRHIEAAISAGMRAKSLIERILAFSRSGIGERTAVHVHSVVSEALDGVAASLPPDVELQRRLTAGDAAVLADPTQLHQVVMNLCANAVHAMRQSGTLAVTLECIESATPVCSTCGLPGGNYVSLSVRDSGSGIAADVRERIFDPFFTTKDIGVGTGLGLSLVHGIVTDLGGGIDVQSQVGEGSTFTVFLPLVEGAAAPAHAGSTAVPRGRGETILLVDDEESLVRLGEEMLAMLGYEPVGFNSGSAALEAVSEAPQRFDAVLSDEAMPAMTGSELARAVRAIRPDLPVVLMSGYVTAALTARAHDVGVVEVLSKPLVSAEIARSLAGALRRRVLQPQSSLPAHDTAV